MADPERDYSILRLIQAAIEETNEFPTVRIGERPTPERTDFSAGATPAAVITPLSWEQVDTWSDPEDFQAVRRSRALVTLVVREDDESRRIDLLDRLSRVVSGVLDGVSLGGMTVVGETRVLSGQWQAAAEPEKHLVLTVGWATLTDSEHDSEEFEE